MSVGILCAVMGASATATPAPAPPSTLAAKVAAPLASTPFEPAPSYQAPCVEGQSRSSTVYSQTFNSIPESRFNSGFSSQPGGTRGERSAKSLLSGAAINEYMFLPYQQVPVGARTMLGFTTKGSGQTFARVGVNSVLTNFDTSSRWRGVSVDITAATRDESGWLSTWFEHRGRSGTSSSLSIDQAEIYRCRTNATQRIGGADRYAVAAKLSETFATRAPVVYVATGENFPDALSAGALAGGTDAPILLAKKASIPSSTRAALRRLEPRRIIIVGGPESVSGDVRTALESYAPVVGRVSGTNRYDVSARVSSRFDRGVDTAFVATGATFPDALAGGALAADRGGPMLLTGKGSIPEDIRAELSRLQPENIVVLGGPASVSNTVLDQLARYAGGGRQAVERIGGADRYEVSANVAKKFTRPSSSYLSNGSAFADAIVGGAAAGSVGAPLLLTRANDLPDVVDARLRSISEAKGVVLGGLASVESIARDQYGRTLP